MGVAGRTEGSIPTRHNTLCCFSETTQQSKEYLEVKCGPSPARACPMRRLGAGQRDGHNSFNGTSVISYLALGSGIV